MNLESHQFMSFFEPDQATQLCEMAVLESFSEGSIIFDEGDNADSLYLLLEGQVEFRKRLSATEYQILTHAFPNAFFGELGILDKKPRSAQAIAYGEVLLANISSQTLMTVLEQTKGTIVTQLCGYMMQRLRSNTEEYVKQLVHKEKMTLLGEMLNTVIHDFKSPLSSINLASSMLKEQHPDEDTAEWCDLIRAQTKRMVAMAEDFLEFSRGNAVLKKTPINLIEVLQRFDKLNRIYLQEAGVELTISCPADIAIEVDEGKFLRVLQNLTMNAVDAFKGQGGRVEIVASVEGEMLLLQIRDNGPGIPEKIRDRLFEAFITYGKVQGTGLGTAIAKSIIEAHGGSISFESELQKGTTFSIRLAIARLS